MKRWRPVFLILLHICFKAVVAYDKERIESKLNHRQRLNKLLFSQIDTDLAPWKEKGISREAVERTYCTEFKGGYIDGGFRLQIVEGEMFVVGELTGYQEFNRHVKLFLLDVARHHKLPDVDLVLSTSDKCHQPGRFPGSTKKCPSQAPLFAYGKRKEDSHCVLYPDHTFGGWPVVNLPSWQDIWDLMEGKQQHSWASRQDTLFFRGAKTGNRSYLADDSYFMRQEGVDVNFTRWTGDPSGEFISLAQHCDYRYLLHLPGQAYSSRLKNLLLCKSPVIFPRDGNDEFWYHLLEGGQNIYSVPQLDLMRGGKDILAALKRLQSDEVKAQRIAAGGHEIVRRALRPDNVRRYFAQLITEYAALQKFTIARHPDAIPMVISAMSPDRNTTMSGRTCDVCS